MKIWVDDMRPMPVGYDYCCRSVNEAKDTILYLERAGLTIDVINLDHDLGDYAKHGGDGIMLLDWLAERQTYYPILLHTCNPVGRANMQRLINRYWKCG